MPKMSDHEEYLDATMVDEGDEVVLLDAGVFREPEESGLSRTVFQIRVGLPDQRKKTWTMNKTTRKKLAQAWGDDSENWVNHKVRITITQQIVRGEQKYILWGSPVEGGPISPFKRVRPEALEQEKINVLGKTDALINHIASEKGTTREYVEAMIEEELKNSGGSFGEHTAAILVARSLGVSLETTGERIA